MAPYTRSQHNIMSADIISYDSRSHHHKSRDIETFLPGYLFYQISRLPLFSFMAYAYFQKKIV